MESPYGGWKFSSSPSCSLHEMNNEGEGGLSRQCTTCACLTSVENVWRGVVPSDIKRQAIRFSYTVTSLRAEVWALCCHHVVKSDRLAHITMTREKESYFKKEEKGSEIVAERDYKQSSNMMLLQQGVSFRKCRVAVHLFHLKMLTTEYLFKPTIFKVI